MGARVPLSSNVIADKGVQLLDVEALNFANLVARGLNIKQIPGVICNGISVLRPADVCIIAGEHTRVIE